MSIGARRSQAVEDYADRPLSLRVTDWIGPFGLAVQEGATDDSPLGMPEAGAGAQFKANRRSIMANTNGSSTSENDFRDAVPGVTREGYRTPAERVQFTLICLGIFIAIPGVIVTSVWASLVGGLLIAEGLIYFLVKG